MTPAAPPAAGTLALSATPNAGGYAWVLGAGTATVHPAALAAAPPTPAVPAATPTPVATISPDPLPNPFAKLEHSVQHRVQHLTVVEDIGLAFLAAAVLGAGVTLFVRYLGREEREAEQRRLMSPRWASRRMVKPLRATDAQARQRLVLGRHNGRLLALQARRSCMVLAPTRAGKTARVVIPTVVRWDGPAVVASVKGDVLEVTYGARVRRGAPVHVFAPGQHGLTGDDVMYPGVTAVRYNPIAGATTWAKATEVVSWLQTCAQVGGAVKDMKFWETQAAAVLAPLVMLAARQGAGIGQVLTWLQLRQHTQLTELVVEMGDAAATGGWAATLANEPRALGSVLATAISDMAMFTLPAVADIVAVDGDLDSAGHVVGGTLLDADCLLEQRATLYVVAPESDQVRYAPIFQSLLDHLVRAKRERTARQGTDGIGAGQDMLLLLEEAANIAPLRDLGSIASTGAGQGIVLMSVWQDITQLRKVYPDSHEEIYTQHSAKVLLSGQTNSELLEQLSKDIGSHDWTDHRNHRRDRDGRKTYEPQRREESTAPVWWLMSRPVDEAIVRVAGIRITRLRTAAYWQDKTIRRELDPATLDRYDRAYGPARRQLRSSKDLADQPAAPPALPATPEPAHSPVVIAALDRLADLRTPPAATVPGLWEGEGLMVPLPAPAGTPMPATTTTARDPGLLFCAPAVPATASGDVPEAPAGGLARSCAASSLNPYAMLSTRPAAPSVTPAPEGAGPAEEPS